MPIVAHLRAFVTFAVVFINTLFWYLLVATGGLFKLFLPKGDLRNRTILLLARFGDGWVGSTQAILDRMLPTRWDIRGVEGLRPDGRYLIVANHRAWLDVLVAYRTFHRQVPFIRFFMKHRLLFVPVIGHGCQSLEFPFVRRYTAEYLERHPEKRGADIITARRACRRYLRIPVALLIFLEGTRQTAEKHADQNSPYRHLLRPRIGGIAHAMAVMGDQLNDFLDLTIAYSPVRCPSLWEFMGGQVARVSAHVRDLEIPEEFRNDSILEAGPAREKFKAWVERLWREKDALLDEMVAEEEESTVERSA